MPSPKDPVERTESRWREIGEAIEFWVLAALVAGAPVYGIISALVGTFRK